jgi:hypothetical protein
MTINIDTGPRLSISGVILQRDQLLLPWLLMAALFAAAIFLRHVVSANTDVSWLITAGERLLDGQRLYADVIETNPPMAVLVYIPGISLARALGIPADVAVDTLVFIAIAVSLGVTARCLRHSSVLDGLNGWLLAILAAAILAILPTQTFGQREHIAMIELLPALAVLAMRMKRETPPRWLIAAAGIGAGLALSFKPYFAISIFFALSALALRSRSWRIFFKPENFIAAAIVAVYVLFIALFYPEFFTVIGPLVRDVYIPVGISFGALLEKPAVPIWAIASLAAIFFSCRGKFDDNVLLLLATSLGFAVVFFLQRKGWPYHSYPMIALGLLALGCALVSRHDPPRLDRVAGVGAALFLVALFARSMLWFDVAFDARPLQPAVERLGSHPKILAITAEPGLGHPLVRALDGTWVSRQPGLWVAGYRQYMAQHGLPDPEQGAAYAAGERAMLIEDFKRNRPTVVLVDNLTGKWGEWLQSNPDVAALLKSYRLRQTANGIDILSE